MLLLKAALSLIILTICCSACNSFEENFSYEPRVLKDGTTIVNVNIKDAEKSLQPFWSLFDSINYINLELKGNEIIGKISKILADDSVYVILDRNIQKGVFIFSKSGKHIKSLIASTSGAGGLKQPADIILDTKSRKIIVLESPWRFKYYNYNGEFLSEIVLTNMNNSLASIRKMSNNSIISFQNSWIRQNNGQKSYSINRFDTSGNKMASFEQSNPNLPHPFIYNDHFYQFDGETYFYNIFNDTIFNILDDDKLSPHIVINFGNQKLPHDFFYKKADLSYYSISTIIKQRGYCHSPSDIRESEDLIYFGNAYEERFVHNYYNKNSRNIKSFIATIDTLFDGAIDITPKGLDGDFLLYEINTQRIHSNYEKMYKAAIKAGYSPSEAINEISKYKPEISKIKNQTTIYGNPLLLLGRVKNF